MPKPEHEFFDTSRIPWELAPGFSSGVHQKVLSRDPDTGDYTRLLKFDPGVETRETMSHDFWEEVIILQGGLIDIVKGQTFTEGMYACRPPGMKHGPYRTPIGCITFEARYYKK